MLYVACDTNQKRRQKGDFNKMKSQGESKTFSFRKDKGLSKNESRRNLRLQKGGIAPMTANRKLTEILAMRSPF